MTDHPRIGYDLGLQAVVAGRKLSELGATRAEIRRAAQKYRKPDPHPVIIERKPHDVTNR